MASYGLFAIPLHPSMHRTFPKGGLTAYAPQLTFWPFLVPYAVYTQ